MLFRSLDDPELLRLASLTKLATCHEFTAAFPGRQGAAVIVRLADGREVRRMAPDVTAAGPAQVRQRFLEAAGEAFGAWRASEIADFAEALETADDVGALMRLTRSEAAMEERQYG